MSWQTMQTDKQMKAISQTNRQDPQTYVSRPNNLLKPVCLFDEHPAHTGSIAPGCHPLDLIHTDVAGPIRVTGHDQSRYWVTCLDDFTQWAEVEPLQHRSQAFSVIRNFIERNELPEKRCRRIRLDRGGENVSHEFALWAYDKGIELEYNDNLQSSTRPMAAPKH